jgi:secreted trypsin-like serine protease
MKISNFICIVLATLCISCSSLEAPPVLDGAGTAEVSQPIIGGSPAVGLQYEAIVGLHRLSKRYGGSVYVLPFCTGTLISPTVVLTAAHCLDKAEDFAPTEPFAPNDIGVYFGDSPGSLDENGDYDVLNGLRPVKSLSIHSGYDKFTISNDIGLIRLKDVAPAVPVTHLDATRGFLPADVGMTLGLVGFGEDENGDYGVKLKADVPLNAIIDGSRIEHAHSPEGVCFGDSGGPALVIRDSISYVGGVASYVTHPYCANTGVHTRVDAFEIWIDNFMNPTTEPPSTCEGLPLGSQCTDGSECCSGKCKGKSGSKTCK